MLFQTKFIRDENNNCVNDKSGSIKNTNETDVRILSYAHSYSHERYEDSISSNVTRCYAHSEHNVCNSSKANIDDEIKTAISEVLGEPEFQRRLATKYIAQC